MSETHTHVSALDAVITACYVLIFAALWRAVAGTLVQSDNPKKQAWGEAMVGIF